MHHLVMKLILCMAVCLEITDSFNFGRTSDHISDITQNQPDKNLINYKDTLAPRAEKQHTDLNNSTADVSIIRQYSSTKRNPLTTHNVLTTSYSGGTNRIVSKGKPLGHDNKHSSLEARHQQTKTHSTNQLKNKEHEGMDISNTHFWQKLVESFQSTDTVDESINSLKMKEFSTDVKQNVQRIRRDVYSLLREDLLKRHQLGSEKNIKRLLEALATIKDLLDKEKAAERRKAARSRLRTMGQLVRVGQGSGTKTEPHIHSKVHKHSSENTVDYPVESPRYESQKQEPFNHRRTKHPLVTRNRHSNKDFHSSPKAGVEFGVRASQNSIDGSEIDKFYQPEFNPTGW